MNLVILTGRLTKDPELKSSERTSVCHFGVAVNRQFKRDGDPDADFINCTAFGKNAEFISKYFRKGSKIDLQGSWRTGSYEGKNGKVYTNEVFVDRAEFGESKSASSNNASSTQPGTDAFMNIPDGLDDEMPFN